MTLPPETGTITTAELTTATPKPTADPTTPTPDDTTDNEPTTQPTTSQPITIAPTVARIQTSHTFSLNGTLWQEAIAADKKAVVDAAQTDIATALNVNKDAVVIDSVTPGSLIVNYRVTSQMATSSINVLVAAGSMAALTTAYCVLAHSACVLTGGSAVLAVISASTVIPQQTTNSCSGGCLALIVVGVTVVGAALIAACTLRQRRTGQQVDGPAQAHKVTIVPVLSPIRREFELLDVRVPSYAEDNRWS